MKLRCLLLGTKAMTNLNSILKSRGITLPTKVHLVKAVVFPVVMCRCESWTIKKAERQRIDALELWCWRRLLRVPWTARRSNQSILKEISPESSLEGLMLMLKLQYFGHLMWRTDSLEKTLMLETIEGGRRGWQRMRWLNGVTYSRHEFEQALGVGEEQGSLACCHPWGRKELVTTKWLDWTGLNCQMEEDLLSFCLILRRVIKSWVEGIAAIMSGPSGTVFWGCCGLVQVTHSSRCLSILQRYLTSILMYSFFFFHLPLLLALSSSLLWTELCPLFICWSPHQPCDWIWR